MKVLGACTSIPYEWYKKINEIGDTNIYHNQFRIICKCKSMADANRKCASFGLHDKVFISGQVSETGNCVELNLCEIEDIWICKSGTSGKDFISVTELIATCKENKELEVDII